MKIYPRFLTIFGCLAALAGSSLMGVQINEIRQDEPGGTDSNEYFELKGTPGESLNDHWYLVVGDHSSFQNPNGENIPNKGGATVEFALDLTGLVIPDDGHLMISTNAIQLEALGITGGDVDDIVDINFENSDNVTHILAIGYTGIEVQDLASQYDDLAVDIDDDDDGVLNETLPWTSVVDAVGIVEVPNNANPEEFVYGVALGGADVGPDGSFTPGHIYRGSDDNAWNIGTFNLLNAEGTGLFLGDDFSGPALDTPGSANPISPEPVLTPSVSGIAPTIAFGGDTVTISGSNLDTATFVTINDVAVDFTVIDAGSIEIVAGDSVESGQVTVGTPFGSGTSDSSLLVVTSNLTVVAYEDFEVDLGTFISVSLASDANWDHGTFGLNGFADISGFSADAASDDYLISSAIDLSAANAPSLLFNTARNFDGPDLEVLVSTDFDGVNPATATWTALTAELSLDDYVITSSGVIDLTTYVGETVYVAFRYTSVGTEGGDGAVYQVHDFLVWDVPAQSGVLLFEDFEVGLGDFLSISLASNEDWEFRTFGDNGFAQASGFRADTASDDWLVSPAVDLTEAVGPVLTFSTARNFDGPVLEVAVSTDFDGINPALATWDMLTATLSQGGYELVASGDVDLSAYVGETIYLGFHYTSTGVESPDGATWQVHEVLIEDSGVAPFVPGWVDDTNLSFIYRYTPDWAYSISMGFVYLADYPWIYNPDFGYFYFAGDDIRTGSWVYITDQWAWLVESNGGFFIYFDGSFNNFLAPTP